MAAFQLPSPSLALSHLQLLFLRSPRSTNTLSLFPIFNSKPITCIGTHPTSQFLLRASINSQTETPKPKRGRKNKSETPSSSSTTPTPTKRRSKKVEIQHEAIKAETETSSTPKRLRSNKAEGEDGVIEAESETSSSTTPTRRRTKNAEGENGEVKPKRTRKKKAKETTAEAVQAVEETKEEVSFQEMYEEDEEERKKKEKELDDKIFAKVARVLLSCQEDRQDEEDDGKMVSSYTDPPLLCCFGAAQKEFLPTVRVSERQMHPDIYSTWKQLQWDPPEFARAPGGPPSNVAISHVRLGGRAAFMGKVGLDRFGNDLVVNLIKEKVSIRGVTYDPNSKTAASYMKFKFEDDGRMIAETVKESAEDSLLSSELIIAVLKEARIFHFNSEVLLTPSMHSSLFRAIELSKKYGGMVFFDLNLPLPLWRSRNETREIIKKAWDAADIVEVTRHELEFLLNEEYYLKKRNYKPQYYAESFEQTKSRRDYYHYSREEIAPLWHDGMKFLFVTDGTLRIHYYGPSFDGVVVGTEDVLITPYTCDRTGSGDTVVAAIMRKLMAYPKMFEDEDMLVRQLRFAIAAGIISQWTIGAVRGFPTESAAQNLKEQVYVPSMW